MTSLTIISALLGVWLGLTFRVLILVPAAILALATVAGSGRYNRDVSEDTLRDAVESV